MLLTLGLLACASTSFAENAVSWALPHASLSTPAAPTAIAQQGGDPLLRLRGWMKRQREGRERFDESSLDELRLLVGDLRLVWAVDPAREDQVADHLLDLLGMTLTTFDAAALDTKSSPVSQVRDLATDALRAHMSDALVHRIAYHTLALPRSQPLPRRVAAAWLLIGRYKQGTMLALFGCARESEPELKSVAVEALLGWNDDAVHMFLIDQMAGASAGYGPLGAVAERHFGQVSLLPESRVRARLAALVRDRLASVDWREASRAVTLSKALDNSAVVPALIEALSAWIARGQGGGQAMRVQFEIAHALESRSGRSLGLHPDNWRLWWEAVRRGDVRGQHPYTTGNVAPLHTTFFGLHPTSDRITFVIDRSGSMSAPFNAISTPGGRAGATRWEEAVNQLIGFVESIGEKSRFNVVIFHDYAEVWRPKLVPATLENRRNAREWLSKRPNGGTQLRAGVERAMMIGADGNAVLSQLEADTVIVLCDGETAEGPGWVEPFLERVNSHARVMFHGVQIGSRGDGTLEKLAEGSGGQFVRSDG
jgi:hypothetical protein